LTAVVDRLGGRRPVRDLLPLLAHPVMQRIGQRRDALRCVHHQP
jgi:hypothetical protein